MPKIIYGFELDTDTKIFKPIGNTDPLTAVQILLDVVRCSMAKENQPGGESHEEKVSEQKSV